MEHRVYACIFKYVNLHNAKIIMGYYGWLRHKHFDISASISRFWSLLQQKLSIFLLVISIISEYYCSLFHFFLFRIINRQIITVVHCNICNQYSIVRQLFELYFKSLYSKVYHFIKNLSNAQAMRFNAYDKNYIFTLIRKMRKKENIFVE